MKTERLLKDEDVTSPLHQLLRKAVMVKLFICLSGGYIAWVVRCLIYNTDTARMVNGDGNRE